MQLNKIIQRDYTSFSLYYQIKLPLDLEISIPSDDPVRLVSAFVEEMDLSELYKTYGRIRKNQATPKGMSGNEPVFIRDGGEITTDFAPIWA